MSNASIINAVMSKADLRILKRFEDALESAEAQNDESRMIRIHSQMSQLVEGIKNRGELESNGVEPDWHQQARNAGNMVEAIKLVREHTGWGLRESKDWVDEHCGRLKAKQKDAAIERLEEDVERLERVNGNLRYELFSIRERLVGIVGPEKAEEIDDDDGDF